MSDSGKIFKRLAESLREDTWLQTARPNQLPPPGNWYVWLFLAGRGFGKTRAATEWVRSQVESGNARNIAIVGATAADVRDTCVEGPSGILAVSPSWNRPTYEPSKRRLTWPSGAIATLFSSEEPDRLRGPNIDLAYCDELASWTNMEMTWDMLQMTLRLGKHPRCVVATTLSRSVPLN
jgi:phage terminase large subunit-like protein